VKELWKYGMVVAPWFGFACPMVVDDGASGAGVDALAAEPSPTSMSAASGAPAATVLNLI
jgi:hypothetical protein